MKRLSLTGGSYDARGVAVAAQRTLNLYPEPVPAGDGEPVPFAYYRRPGLVQIATIEGDNGRAAYQTTQGDLVIVVGGNVCVVTADGAVNQIGVIAAGSSPVRMSDNGTTLFLVDGTKEGGWYISMPSKPQDGRWGKMQQIDRDPAFYGSATIAILDTFFLFVNPDTSNWYTSPAQFADEKTTPFDSLYVASDATSLSTIQAVAVSGQYIWLFGRWQTELWYDSGAADFPFQRVAGVTIESGCIAPYSVVSLPTTPQTPNGGTIWLGQDKAGTASVFLGANQMAKNVATSPVQGALQDMGDLSQAVGNLSQFSGHLFYTITVPGQPSSWVYDVTFDLWHEECALDGAGNESQIRPLFWTQAYGSLYGVDHSNGAIYKISLDAQDDAGNPIKRQRAFPHLLTDGTRAIHRRFGLDMQQCAGVTVNADWSDDRGKTFCLPIPMVMSDGGWPTIWRLGLTRDRVYRVTWTDPAETALMGAFLDIDPVRN